MCIIIIHYPFDNITKYYYLLSGWLYIWNTFFAFFSVSCKRTYDLLPLQRRNLVRRSSSLSATLRYAMWPDSHTRSWRSESCKNCWFQSLSPRIYVPVCSQKTTGELWYSKTMPKFCQDRFLILILVRHHVTMLNFVMCSCLTIFFTAVVFQDCAAVFALFLLAKLQSSKILSCDCVQA